MSQLWHQHHKIKAQAQQIAPEATIVYLKAHYYENLVATSFPYIVRDWGLKCAQCPSA